MLHNKLDKHVATFHAHVTTPRINTDIDREFDYTLTNIYFNSAEKLSFRIDSDKSTINDEKQGDDYRTLHLKSNCYANQADVDYDELNNILPTENISKDELLDKNNHVRSDLQSDLITKTHKNAKMGVGNIVVCWYEIIDE